MPIVSWFPSPPTERWLWPPKPCPPFCNRLSPRRQSRASQSWVSPSTPSSAPRTTSSSAATASRRRRRGTSNTRRRSWESPWRPSCRQQISAWGAPSSIRGTPGVPPFTTTTTPSGSSRLHPEVRRRVLHRAIMLRCLSTAWRRQPWRQLRQQRPETLRPESHRRRLEAGAGVEAGVRRSTSGKAGNVAARRRRRHYSVDCRRRRHRTRRRAAVSWGPPRSHPRSLHPSSDRSRPTGVFPGPQTAAFPLRSHTLTTLPTWRHSTTKVPPLPSLPRSRLPPATARQPAASARVHRLRDPIQVLAILAILEARSAISAFIGRPEWATPAFRQCFSAAAARPEPRYLHRSRGSTPSTLGSFHGDFQEVSPSTIMQYSWIQVALQINE